MELNLVESIKNYKYENCVEDMTKELLWSLSCQDQIKDILIVVKDQLEYVQNCIDSIYQNTNNFNLFLWDNASEPETAHYLESVYKQHNNCFLTTSETNKGFIMPNNRLARHTKSPYIILLNSDTEVKKDWDRVLLGVLQNNPEIAATGYGGCVLDENFKGGNVSFNHKIDYVSGWCLCINRSTYEEFGLFDEQFQFAYCEDADYGLKLKSNGRQIYAINLDLVTHYENKTVKKLILTPERTNLQTCFKKNHELLTQRWKNKGIALFEVTQTA